MHRSLKTLTLSTLALVLMVGSLFGAAGVTAQDDQEAISVGSKNFTEQIVLGEMMAILLEDAGYTVDRSLNLGGLALVHEGLVSGELDVYVEYTGTGLVAVLEQEVPEGDSPDEVAQATYDQVAEAYMDEWNLVWLDELGFNNTYALAVTQETAEEYDLETTSDLVGVAEEMTMGTDPEVLVREDGLPGLQDTYGFEFGDAVAMDSGLMYQAVDNGDVDIITAFTTDGRIAAMDLVLLEDDLGFFPPYYAAPVVRQDTIDANEGIQEVLNQLSGAISDEEMAQMNFQVDDENADPADVARTFLEDEGIIGGE